MIYDKLPAYAIALFLTLYAVLAIPVTCKAQSAEIYYMPAESITDYFVLCREILLFAFSAALVVYFIGERIFPDSPLKPRLLADKRYIPLFVACTVYVAWVLISSIFSDYPEISFWGGASEHEGIAAVLSYAVLMLAAYNCFGGADRRLPLCIAVFGAAGTVSLLTLVEIFTGSFGELISGTRSDNAGSALLFGNPSLCGQFCCALIPPVISLALSFRKKLTRTAGAVLAGILFLEVIRSASTAAFYTSAFGMVLVLAAAVAKKRISLRDILIASAGALLPTLIFTAVFPKTAGSLIASGAVNTGAYSTQDSFGIIDMNVEGNDLYLTSEYGAELTVTVNGGKVSFSDGNDAIPAHSDGEYLIPDGEAYRSVRISDKDGLLTVDLGYAEPVYFQITDDTVKYIGINGYLEDEIAKPAFPELSEYYGIATGRGHIWLTTVNMLKDCLFKGCGAGGFMLHFPQNDVVGSLRTHGRASVVIDKPHCMYLQIFTLYGLPALIAFVAMAVMLMRSGIACILKGSTAGTGAAVSVLCSLVLGIVNDSCVVTAVWLWFFAGMIMACDLWEENEGNEKNESKPPKPGK